jgi:hypothetical protein
MHPRMMGNLVHTMIWKECEKSEIEIEFVM